MTVPPPAVKPHQMYVHVPYSWAFIPTYENPVKTDPKIGSDKALTPVPSDVRISNIVDAVIESVKLAQAGPQLYSPVAQVVIHKSLTEDERDIANGWMGRHGGVIVGLPGKQGGPFHVEDGPSRMWAAWNGAQGHQIPVQLSSIWWCSAMDKHMNPDFDEMITQFGYTSPQFQDASSQVLQSIKHLKRNWATLRGSI